MKPVVDGLQQQYKGKVDFIRLNTDKLDSAQTQLANQYAVTVIPTFVFVNKDGSLAKKVVGEMKADALRTQLDALK